MRIVKRDLKANMVLLVPETVDDLWHLEKVIEVGDVIKATTFRKYKTESGKADRKKVRIELKLEQSEFHKYSNHLRLLGTIIAGSPEEFVSIGSHHTIEVTPEYMFSITKLQGWKNYQLKRLKEAVAASKKPKLLIAIMDDEATDLGLVKEWGVDSVGTISSGKSGKDFKTDKSVKFKYFEEVAQALLVQEVERMVVAGAGFAKEDFGKYLQEKHPQLLKKIVFQNIGGYGRSAISEVLKGDQIKKIAEDARITQEAALVDKLVAEIGKEALATYGAKEVEEALDYGAVEELLIVDSFFVKNRDLAERLIRKAEEIGAHFHIVSIEHDAGEQLKSLGSVGAILRFKVE